MLAHYLKNGTDVYDYRHRFGDFLEDEGWEDDSELHPWYVRVVEDGEDASEACDEWLESVGESGKVAFRHWLENHGGEAAYDSPAYETMSYVKYGRPGWLVHFTDDAWAIADKGFMYGHPDLEGLHLTTWKRERKGQAGYDFAFEASGRDIRRVGDKYGSQMVLFWSSGVEAYHSGDEEHQVVFWGSSVRTDMIFPAVERDGMWMVEGRGGRLLYSDESVQKVIGWMESDWRMLQKVQKVPAVRDVRPRGKAASVTFG